MQWQGDCLKDMSKEEKDIKKRETKFTLTNMRFNEKKGLLFLNILKQTREPLHYESETINIRLNTKDMTKINHFLNSLRGIPSTHQVKLPDDS